MSITTHSSTSVSSQPTSQSEQATTDQARLWQFFTWLSQMWPFGSTQQTASPQDQATQALYYQQAWDALAQPQSSGVYSPYAADPNQPTFLASQISPADRQQLYILNLDADLNTHQARLAAMQKDLALINSSPKLKKYFSQVDQQKAQKNTYSRFRFQPYLRDGDLGAKLPDLKELRERYSFVVNPDGKKTSSPLGSDLHDIYNFLKTEVGKEKLEVGIRKAELEKLQPGYYAAYDQPDEDTGE